jgi:hypothetical protein
LGEFFEEGADLGFEVGVWGREAGQGLHGESFHDAAFVAEVVEENVEGRGAFRWGEVEARDEEGGVQRTSCWMALEAMARNFFLKGWRSLGRRVVIFSRASAARMRRTSSPEARPSKR